MARKRMIDPSFWIDEKLGKMELINRLLFMGLISNSDDEGRLVGNFSLINSIIFPYDGFSIKKIEKAIKEIANLNMIIVYTNDNQQYIQIVNFLEYQTINKPTKSKYPSYNSSSSVVILR